MKIRTDFVTNSSSSSFIFKEKNIDEMKNRIKKLIENEPDDFDRKMALDHLEYIKVKAIREYHVEDILDVYCWYQDEMFAMWFEDFAEYNRLTWDERDVFMDRFIDSIKDRRISDDVLMKIAGLLVMKFADSMPWGERTESLSAEKIESYFSDYIESDWWYHDRILYEITMHNYEKIQKMIMKYADVHVGEILEEVLGAKYMYFNDYETHYLVGNLIVGSPECILGCNHMG